MKLINYVSRMFLILHPVKKILNYLQIDKYYTFFVFLISYLIVVSGRITAGQRLEVIFLPDGPISTFLAAFMMMFLIRATINHGGRKVKSESLSPRLYFRYFVLSMVVYLMLSNVLSLSIALIFDTFERNFNQSTLILSNLSITIDFIIFGSLYLAYCYSVENVRFKQQLSSISKAMDISKIEQLKTQLNPHFLFNNLNTLDQLIEEDKTKASDFLNHFADLYRYSLVTSGKQLVNLSEEIDFVKSYFQMMEHKYAHCYQLNFIGIESSDDMKVPPFCLQVLVENAIEHNLGTIENPVVINISIGKTIEVSNNKISKKYKKKTGGRALANLADQFALIANQNITIQDEANKFSVNLPVVTSAAYV
ncbi:sensor histidine kinase [Penaeicola halotolerans]|uniref:sensor histidine kinase n=1 Tax=Penaeicola halotolerans TaxID=2793196 RepID=UPI001CF849C5|nr:sensor histidine kinase [Penaeicola halotolerans]